MSSLPKRQKKSKKSSRDSPVKGLLGPVFGKVSLVLVCGALGAFPAVWAWHFLSTSSYFSIKKIETFGHENLSSYSASSILNRYKGKNIFSVDVKAIERQVRDFSVDIDTSMVRKTLPDTITIVLAVREPCALVKDETYLPIDAEGVILANIKSTAWKRLPVITGVTLRKKEISQKKCESKNITVALELLAEIKRSGILRECDVSSVDVSDYKNPTFSINDGVEIRVGLGSFRDALQSLKSMLKDPKLSLSQVRYIDLRFKDAVIGPK